MTTISAQIIADSVSPGGVRLTTMQLRYPRFIHGEFLTHRQFSRNASSSRAIPVKRLIDDVERDPVYPLHWGKNMSGMQAKEEHNALVRSGDGFLIYREDAWWEAMSNAINTARAFADAGYHKQIVNRLLEPFAHINVVVTATEWSNFFALRRHEDAEPHIKLLAYRMWEAMKHSVPAEIDTLKWHLPYITAEDIWMLKDDPTLSSKLIKISVARCARVSYFTHDGKTSHIDKDLELYDRLVGAEPLHASPAEHQATPATDPKVWSGNFRGWIQYRKGLIGECQ